MIKETNKKQQYSIEFDTWDFKEKAAVKPVDEPGDDVDALKFSEDANIYYMSFGSGSSGNSCYIGTDKEGIIIDAGVKPDDIASWLRVNGVSMDRVKAVCLTHDHADHVRFAYNLVRKYKHIKVYCTNRTLNGIFRRHNVSKRIKDYHIPIFKEIPFKIGKFELTAFDVPHDGEDNVGFSIKVKEKTFVVATDLGKVAERAYHYMSQANYLMIEANYDVEMLRLGPYPEYLKARIQMDNGHLDNADTAKFLKEIINPSLKYIFLCHLSKDNNTPEKAVETVRNALTEEGLTVGYAQETIEDRKANVQLMALPRYEPSRWFVLK